MSTILDTHRSLPSSPRRAWRIGAGLALLPLTALALASACTAVETDDVSAPPGDEQERTAEAQGAITGSWPIVTLGCKVPDINPNPGPISQWNDLVARDSYPGVSHYFRAVSGDTFNLTGSQAFGWFTLPKTSAAYTNPDGSKNLDLLTADCMALADPSVYFPSFKGIHIVTNEFLGADWGGPTTYTIDGVTKTYGAAWFNYSQKDRYAGTIIHEIGHGLGLRHAAATMPPGQFCPYANVFDPMSTYSYNNCDPTWGCFPAYFQAYNRDFLSWIPGRISTVPAGTTQTLNLVRSNASSGPLAAKVMINASQYYLVEARRKGGTNVDNSPSYEADLETEGATVTFVPVQNGYWETQLEDADNDCDMWDPEAIWTPGEMFTDGPNGFRANVLAATADGYQVAVSAPTKLTVSSVGGGTVTTTVVGMPPRDCVNSTCSYQVLPLPSATLTATGSSSRKFASWTGCPSPSGAVCTFTPGGASMNVTANFEVCGNVDPFCYSSCYADCLSTHSKTYCKNTCNLECIVPCN